jgi:hypothetical protein
MKKSLGLLLLILFYSCESDNSNDDQNNKNYEIFISALVDGKAFESGVEAGATSNNDPYGSVQSYQTRNNGASCIDINYGPGLYPYGDESLGNMGIGFISFLSNSGLTCADELDNFNTLFPINSYNYVIDEYGYGVSVDYSPENSSDFYLSYGSQDSSASFKITNVEDLTCGFSKCLNISGTFSCRLYNEDDANDFIDITNGKFKLLIQSFNP